jgi:hypothetical protein
MPTQLPVGTEGRPLSAPRRELPRRRTAPPTTNNRHRGSAPRNLLGQAVQTDRRRSTDLSGSGPRGNAHPPSLCFPIRNGVLVRLLHDSPPARRQEPGPGTQPCGISATTTAARCDRTPDRSVTISYRTRPNRTLPRRPTSSRSRVGGGARLRRGRRDLGRLSPHHPGFTRSVDGSGRCHLDRRDLVALSPPRDPNSPR